MKIKRTHKSNKSAILIIVTIIVVAFSAVIVWQKDSIMSWVGIQKSNFSNSDDANSFDSSNATDEASVKDGTNDEEHTGSDITSESTKTPAAQNIAVQISDASQYDNNIEIRAYINNVIESDGQCTVTLKNGKNTLTKTSRSLTNPSYTNCETIIVPVSEFPSKGTWDVTVNYSSPKSQGSTSTTVEVR